MLKLAYQYGVEMAYKEAGLRQMWTSLKGLPQRWREGRALNKSLRTGAADPIFEVPSRAGLGEGLRAMTSPGGVPAVAKGGLGEGVKALTAAAPTQAKGVPGWAKMLGVGGLGGGAYYAGTKTAPSPQATGSFFGFEPAQGLQQLSPEMIQRLIQGQGGR